MTAIRRVSVGFDWPLNEVWAGYLPPEHLSENPCQSCDQQGTTPARRWVEHLAHLAMILDDDLEAQARGHQLHPWLGDGSIAFGLRPSPDIREWGTGLAGREGGLMGHDAIDRLRAGEKLVEAAGLDPATWGICSDCGGHGSVEAYPGQRAEAEAWEPTDPPSGDGWQAWETVSEGSPISPVFPTRDGLVDWFTTPDSIWGARRRTLTRAEAERLVDSGWSPSLVAGPTTGVMSGDEWVGGGGDQ